MASNDPQTKRIRLLSLGPEERDRHLDDFLREAGEPAYRSRQLRNWVFRRRARSFDEITTLPAGLRDALADRYSLTPLVPAHTARSADGTIKHLWGLADGEQVESVLIPTEGRLTLCLSSQAGCALACAFCATGHFGFRRQLDASEIVAQYRESARVAEMEGRQISNVVYMGMGEPLANLGPVLTSLRGLHEGFGFGARRITVSTVGLVPGIRALGELPEPFGLAVSLHAPNHELRSRLMPVERRYPLPVLMEALRAYAKRKRRRITFEYTLIERVNDAPRLARELIDLVRGLPCYVNLIPFNPIPQVDWRPSPAGRVERFARTLRQGGVEAAVRTPRGRDIAAACGQLRLERELPGAGPQPSAAPGSREPRSEPDAVSSRRPARSWHPDGA